MTDELKQCPQCESPYCYASGEAMYICPDCSFAWQPSENHATGFVVKDANGSLLQDGDTVIVMKDLPVKGAPKAIKAGTKVKNIRLNDSSDHNIDCKIDGFGAMALKSEFVRKAN